MPVSYEPLPAPQPNEPQTALIVPTRWGSAANARPSWCGPLGLLRPCPSLRVAVTAAAAADWCRAK